MCVQPGRHTHMLLTCSGCCLLGLCQWQCPCKCFCCFTLRKTDLRCKMPQSHFITLSIQIEITCNERTHHYLTLKYKTTIRFWKEKHIIVIIINVLLSLTRVLPLQISRKCPCSLHLLCCDVFSVHVLCVCT